MSIHLGVAQYAHNEHNIDRKITGNQPVSYLSDTPKRQLRQGYAHDECKLGRVSIFFKAHIQTHTRNPGDGRSRWAS